MKCDLSKTGIIEKAWCRRSAAQSVKRTSQGQQVPRDAAQLRPPADTPGSRRSSLRAGAVRLAEQRRRKRSVWKKSPPNSERQGPMGRVSTLLLPLRRVMCLPSCPVSPNSFTRPRLNLPSPPRFQHHLRPGPDWRPPPPAGPGGLGVSPMHNNKPAAAVVEGQAALGRNGGPLTSTPRTPAAKGKTVAVSPAKSPSPLCGDSPLVGSPPGQSWRERDSGLSQSLLAAPDCGDSHAEELGKLLEECRTSLEILRPLLAEVKNLKSTLQTERGEWLQFQADLQVAVSVADRLRAEGEEELAALRAAHEDVERELAAAQQRQREADVQLVTLRAELQESRQRLAALSPAQGRTDGQAPRQEPERPSAEPANASEGKEGTQRATDRAAIRSGREGVERRSENDPTKNVVGEEARTGSKGVAKRYLRNVTNEDRSGEEVRSAETGRTVTTGRSRSQDGFNLLLRRHGGSKRNSLLRWCQSRTQGYKNIDITNFSSSWADGLAFCAVYHTYLPSHVPYSSLTPENKRDNLSLAFKTGGAVGIAQTLTAEEMLKAGGPDWQRVLSYVESMYRHFEM
ncbi:putative cytospin-A-like [Scophthalmus maximus]|uniref:Cytospin-A n=1 Tax=Scophthalmus maximus TaxID=52904 RepID=A0A2U9CKZ5_SCOMX|nr:putative cytospin-A-like [Scophthalmus maximus]